MRDEVGLVPDDQTFMALMIGCSYSGDDEYAEQHWSRDIMQIKQQKGNNGSPGIEWNCYIIAALTDCMARKGSLEEGMAVITEYETTGGGTVDDVMWGSLLNGCIKHKDQVMAERVFEGMMHRFGGKKEFGARMTASCVVMRNLYALNGEHEKVKKMRYLMKVNGWKKKPGFSEIDVYGKLHRFHAGDEYLRKKDEAEYQKIDGKLKELKEKFKREYGYQHDTGLITRDLHEEETEESVLWRHSEKIALSYGLLTTKAEHVIVINKNLRICSDCHEFMRLVSLTESRKVIVTDANRVHVFEHGQCSCKGYY